MYAIKIETVHVAPPPSIQQPTADNKCCTFWARGGWPPLRRPPSHHRPPVTVRYFYCTACHSATCNKNTRTIFRYRLMLWRTTKTKRRRAKESFSTRNYIESVHVYVLLLRNVNFIYFKATLDERRSQVRPSSSSVSVHKYTHCTHQCNATPCTGWLADRQTDRLDE